MQSQKRIKEKLYHIKDYYIGVIIIAVVAVAAALFLIKDFVKQQKTTVFSVAMIECDWSEKSVGRLKETIENILNIDLEKEQCIIENNYTGEQNASAAATTAAYMRTGQVDLVIAPEKIFNRYAVADYLLPIDNLNIEELTAKIDEEDRFYATLYDYSTPGAVRQIPFHPHEETENAQCYGIYLHETDFLQTGYVIGVMKNTSHQEAAETVLQFCLTG